jgi:hypothetical protein
VKVVPVEKDYPDETRQLHHTHTHYGALADGYAPFTLTMSGFACHGG